MKVTKEFHTRLHNVVEANRKLRDLAKQMYAALDYASSLTEPEGPNGCECRICGAMRAYERSEVKRDWTSIVVN